MPGQPQAFLGRQPIVDRVGELVGYELLYRATGSADRACFDDEDAASLKVLSTLLHDLGAPAVLAGRQAFIKVGQRSLREMGFGIAVSARPPHASLEPWLTVASHLKIDLHQLDDEQLEMFVATLRYRDHALIAERVETADQARRCIDLGFHALQGWHVGRPEVMGSVKLGVSHAVLRRVIAQLDAGAAVAELEQTMRLDAALCWRLMRYTGATDFGKMIPIESMRHALELVGTRRLGLWLQLLLNTVDEPSPAAATLVRAAVFRGRMLEMIGAGYFTGTDLDNLFLVGAMSLLPAMLMQPMAEAIGTLALPEAVADALTMRQGRYGPLLKLAEALESGTPERDEALCARLTITSRKLVQGRRSAHASVQEAALA
jgi:EAL and modified HD-GYP domain-containing signal transduction protein